jgi:tripartite-type tricarboxylate transporter receptor subunit TctC
LLVGFTPGSGADVTARLIAQWLSERLGQPFVVENRPGQGTNMAAEAVTRAPADGHTLLLVLSAHAIGATLYDKLSFNLVRDIAPVASISRGALAMEVNLSVPVKSVPEFIAYAKAHPGKLNMGSSGNGSTGHVAGELFKMLTGVDFVHVPYRGGANVMTDMLGGQVQVMFDVLSSSIEPIRAGKVRALAVTTADRQDSLPHLPAVGEFVPGYDASTWNGVGSPKRTPAEIIDKLNKEINAGLADPKLKAKLANLGYSLVASTPAAFGRFIADETEKWAKVVKFSGAKPD